MDDLSPVVIIAGPTASGKTELALKTAELVNGEVVNADSMQVYADLRILTARPADAEMGGVPHHLFGCLSASERCSAGRWLEMASDAIADIHQRRRVPVIAGGTGLYIKALTDGLAEVPEIPDEIVESVSAQYDDVGGEKFLNELKAVDPEAAERLPPTDRQRLIRAAAVFAGTGRTLSDWQAEQPDKPGYVADYLTVLLMPPREEMYAAIDARFDKMMELGALDEAREFKALGLASDLPAMRAVGVAELLRHLDGEMGLETAVSKAKTASRQLAKRQMTWFRRQIRTDLIVDEKYLERDNEKIFSFIRKFLLTTRA
ncbi:MAG: tRNA (adenosine(37)-N6)-dimethylallyltransferase MiaA [Rhodospirillales bacterium]|nr:tRNA (adenosine(37)-N6)-dimethylallyltransferase MiaA [Rhodospirillales bacterium]